MREQHRQDLWRDGENKGGRGVCVEREIECMSMTFTLVHRSSMSTVSSVPAPYGKMGGRASLSALLIKPLKSA